MKIKRSEDPAGLLDIPANFQARDLGSSIGHIVSFPKDQASFGGRRFIQALTAAKPARAGMLRKSQDKSGILADWDMLKSDKREKYSPYDYLHRKHTASTWPLTIKLKEHFREIGENHFMRFWDAINSNVQDEVARNLELGFETLMSEEKALAMYGLDFLKSNFLRFLIITDKSFRFRDALSQFLKREANVAIPDLSGDFRFGRNNSALFKDFTHEMEEKLITDFYKQLDDDKRKKLIYQAVSLFNFAVWEQTILIDENGNPHDMYEDMLIRNGRRISRISDNEVEVRESDSYIRVEFVRDEETGFREPRLTERYLAPQEGEIAPVIIWETDKTTGRRKYFCGKISKELIEAFPDMFFPTQDTLFGQIVVAGYSDNLKYSLPTKLPLVKGGKPQDMLEAQMLEFPKLFSGAYLKSSPVISGFEGMGPIVRIK